MTVWSVMSDIASYNWGENNMNVNKKAAEQTVRAEKSRQLETARL